MTDRSAVIAGLPPKRTSFSSFQLNERHCTTIRR